MSTILWRAAFYVGIGGLVAFGFVFEASTKVSVASWIYAGLSALGFVLGAYFGLWRK